MRGQDPADDGVGHDLAAAAGVAGGLEPVDLAEQRGVHGDAVLDREQGGEPGHGVGGGAQGGVPLGLGAAPACGHGGGVEPGGALPGRGGELPLAHGLQGGGVAGEVGVDAAAVGQAQAAGLPGEDGGLPAGDPAGPEGVQGVGHLVAQHPGQAEVLLAAVRGLASGQGDLGGDAAALPGRGHPGRGGLGALGGVELAGDHRLGGPRRRR
ncbi:hypothetical protein GCM10009844_21740 [Nocardioides koreensis]|uniref:Uncharacterized protein n=1 Tax=Nocardioides koreensis TaxID=433651 RepID=A0ABN2ZQV9_9ACTN